MLNEMRTDRPAPLVQIIFCMEVNALNKLDFLSGGGEAGQVIRSIDWLATPAGLPATWPQQLHTAVSILLHSHVPMFIAWGPTGTLLYNDAFQPLIPGVPAEAVGKPVQTVFAEQWHILEPAFGLSNRESLQQYPISGSP